jgi:hypothetical protein
MSAFGVPTFVVHANTAANPCTATVNTGTGDLICVAWSGLNAPTTVTDTIGNTYSLNLANGFVQNGFGTYQYMFYCVSSTGSNASNVVSVNFSGAVSGVVSVWSVPISGSASFDIAAKGTGNSGNPVTAAFTTTGTDELVFVGTGSQTFGGTYTPGSGYTLDNGHTAAGFLASSATQHQLFSSTQTGITAGFTGSGDYAIVAIGFKGVAAAASSAVVVILME